MPGEVVLGGGIVEDGASSRASGNLSSGGARGLLPWRRGEARGPPAGARAGCGWSVFRIPRGAGKSARAATQGARESGA